MPIQAKHKNIPIPEDLHKKLKIKVANQGGTIKDVIIKLIQKYLGEK